MGVLFVILLQVFIPGWLLSDFLGEQSRAQHPVLRFVWALSGGLCLTISLGAAAHALNLPISTYVLALHGLAFLLALLPKRSASRTEWHPDRASLGIVVALVLLCGIALRISIEFSGFRFITFADRTHFISLTDWLANSPDDPALVSRVVNGGQRLEWRQDGWMYVNAVWVWSSGVPADRFIWYYLSPIFATVIPLIWFAIALELTNQERTALWCAFALIVLGLVTIDANALHIPDWSFAQGGFFDLRTLRSASTALVLPISLFIALSLLKSFKPQLILLFALAGIALMSMHPRQTLILLGSIASTVLVTALVRSKFRFTARNALWIMAILIVLVPIPVLLVRQRLAGSFGSAAGNAICASAQSGVVDTASIGGAGSYARVSVVAFTLPVIGRTYVIDPESVIYHPLLWIAVGLGLLAILRIKRDRAAVYIFSSTATALGLVFVLPPAAQLISQVMSLDFPLGNICQLTAAVQSGLLFNITGAAVFMLPVALTLGYGIDLVFQYVGRFQPAARLRMPVFGVGGPVILVLLLVGPVSFSAASQLDALHQDWDHLRIGSAEEEMLEALKTIVPAGQRSIILAPAAISNTIIESVPHTLVTGGAETVADANRFFVEATPPSPWLDDIDVAFLRRTATNYIVIEAGNIRVPQLLLQPDRFRKRASPAGYLIFQVRANLAPNVVDKVFGQMNAIYRAVDAPRWTPADGFALVRSADSVPWQPIMELWRFLLDQQPNNDLVRFGQAFTATLMGRDGDGLPLWASLQRRYPNIHLLTDGLAFTSLILGQGKDAVQILMQSLSSPSRATQVLAARSLLTDSFLYLLNDDEVKQVITATSSAPDVWHQLAERGRFKEVQKRCDLILGRNLPETSQAAARWLDQLPGNEQSANDVLAQAIALLMQGQQEDALALLKQSTDPIWLIPKIRLHDDRWPDNVAAQAYYLIQGELAFRANNLSGAESAYRQAIDTGSHWAGPYFLAQVLTAEGRQNEARQQYDDLNARWKVDHEGPFPELVSLLSIADNKAFFVMQPHITQDENRHRLTIGAVYGNLPNSYYPVKLWRFMVTNAGASQTFVSVDAPAISVAGALIRAEMGVPIPDVPPLTQGRVSIEPRYDNAVLRGPLSIRIALNRPTAATIDPAAKPSPYQFGQDIRLKAYHIERVAQNVVVTLYWTADRVPTEDYQIYVHILDNDQIITQSDSAPVNGNYPTSQWRTNTVIEDQRVLPLSPSMDLARLGIRVGIYRLPDMYHLPALIDGANAGTEVTLQP